MDGYFSDSDDEDLHMNAFTNVEFKLNNTDFHVFHLIMYLEECEVRLLKTFKTEEEAETYAKQQYFLTTGNYPFVDEKRNEIPITYSKNVDLVDDDTYEYLIIMNNETMEAHSLNQIAEWYIIFKIILNIIKTYGSWQIYHRSYW